MLEESVNPKGKLFLQDGDLAQNNRKALEVVFDIGARKFTIHARNPDLNPIENVFHNVKAHIREDAFTNNIKQEDYSQFCKRVKHTLMGYSPEVIDKTIKSMDKRINLVIKARGQRTKY